MKSCIEQDVLNALKEDIGDGDITAGLIDSTIFGSGVILSREPMVVCGIPWVNRVFFEIDPSIKLDWAVQEGDYLEKGMVLGHVKGSLRHILTAERTALNFLQTLSGVATETRRYVLCLENTEAILLDTRKTIPGLRHAEKYAVRCGGGMNHRMGLYDAILIKENHIKACGSIDAAVRAARASGLGDWIEVEVENLDELKVALAAAPDKIMLDNFDLVMLQEAVKISRNYPVKLEASGGIHLDNIAAIARTGVHYISVGAMTKSLRAIDLSLLLEDGS